MSERPLVSVIIPNYNYAKTLRLCLEAVYAQTYPAIEVIVVDDGSTDSSPQIAREFPCTLVASSRNAGVSAARNLGAARSRGRILFFLDSDVALAPDAVANAVHLLEQDPECGCVCGIYDKEPLIRDSLVEEYRILHGHYWRRSCEGPVHTGFFSLGAVRREVFEEVGPFDERLRATEDVEYGNRLSRRHRMVLSSRVVGRHDDDDRLSTLVRKQYERSLPLVSLFVRSRRDRPVGVEEAANRRGGVLSAVLAVLTLPLALLSPAWLPLPLACLLWFAVSDPGLARFVLREKGFAFFLFFTGVHLVLNLTLALAAGVGLLRWLVSPDFRRLYDGVPGRPAGPAPAAPGATTDREVHPALPGEGRG